MTEKSGSNRHFDVDDGPEKMSSSRRVLSVVLEFSSLSVATVLLLATFVVNTLSTLSNAEDLGFKNGTGNISDLYPTQITPAGWTFSIWGVIYVWQSLWIIYAWSFAFRPMQTHTVPWTTFLSYAFSSVGNITWIYVWGNEYPQVAFPFIVLVAISLYVAVGFAAVHLYRVSSKLRSQQGSFAFLRRIEPLVAQVLVVNGIGIYATWLTLATLINFGIVLQYFADLGAATTGTLMLSVLTVEVLAYFALENTILDRYARYVFIVYPVLIYSIAGILSNQWDIDERQNPIFALVLEVLVCVLFIARIVLWVLFYFFRPLPNSRQEKA